MWYTAGMATTTITDNRKAFHEYSIEDRLEAGIVLTGTEVKSARAGKVNLSDGWVEIDQLGEAYLNDAHIGRYEPGSYMNHSEKRRRKLLLKAKELETLTQKIDTKGYTVIPLKMYFKDQYIKVEIGIAKGKKLHDKRATSKEREANRDISRALRTRNKGE